MDELAAYVEKLGASLVPTDDEDGSAVYEVATYVEELGASLVPTDDDVL